MAAIQSPCIKVCIVEHNSGLCVGCGRSMAEIAGWTAFTDTERMRIMAELPARVENMLEQAAEAAVS